MNLVSKAIVSLITIISCYAYGLAQNVALASPAEIKLSHFNTPLIGSQIHILDKKFGATQPVYSLLHTPQSSMHCGLKVQPFFCRIESQIERKSGLAPRFRLGSLDYTNWLEGKTLFRE